MHFNEKEAGLNWQHRAHKSKKNTICAGHHYVQTNHVSKMYVHSEYIIIYLYFRPWILFNPATFHWSAYIPNLSLKCLYAKPLIEVPIYQTFDWSAYIPNLSLKCQYTKPLLQVSILPLFLQFCYFIFVPIVRYFCFFILYTFYFYL